MGMWDIQPWGNDGAADWYAEFMESTKLRSQWLTAMQPGADGDPDQVRAAIAIFIMLGRVYVWPTEHLDSDLELSLTECRKLLAVEEYTESEELLEQISLELAELESRRKPNASPSSDSPKAKRPWWGFW